MDNKNRVFDFQLDKEEQEMLESFEAGEWKTVDNLEEELARAKAAAHNFLECQALQLEENAELRAEMKNWDEVFGQDGIDDDK